MAITRWGKRRKRQREALAKYLPVHEVIRRVEAATSRSEIRDLYADASDAWLYTSLTAEGYSNRLDKLTPVMLKRSREIRLDQQTQLERPEPPA